MPLILPFLVLALADPPPRSGTGPRLAPPDVTRTFQSCAEWAADPVAVHRSQPLPGRLTPAPWPQTEALITQPDGRSSLGWMVPTGPQPVPPRCVDRPEELVDLLLSLDPFLEACERPWFSWADRGHAFDIRIPDPPRERHCGVFRDGPYPTLADAGRNDSWADFNLRVPKCSHYLWHQKPPSPPQVGRFVFAELRSEAWTDGEALGLLHELAWQDHARKAYIASSLKVQPEQTALAVFATLKPAPTVRTCTKVRPYMMIASSSVAPLYEVDWTFDRATGELIEMITPLWSPP